MYKSQGYYGGSWREEDVFSCLCACECVMAAWKRVWGLLATEVACEDELSEHVLKNKDFPGFSILS